MNEPAEYVIVIVNLIAGFAFAWPLARVLAHARRKPSMTNRLFIYLLGIYFIECIAFAASMSTSIISFVLAFLWGILLGRWLIKSSADIPELNKSLFLFSLYSALPAASLLTVPISVKLGGWSILSSESGARFGIPTFLPWPLCTIVGFCIAVSAVTIALKVLITTNLAISFIKRKKQASI